MLGWVACDTRLCGAFGFSNEKSLTYWVLTEIGRACELPAARGSVMPVGLLPLELSVIGACPSGGRDALTLIQRMHNLGGGRGSDSKAHDRAIDDGQAGERPNEAPMADDRDLVAVAERVRERAELLATRDQPGLRLLVIRPPLV